MLKLREGGGEGPDRPVEIAREFDDPRLELLRLLHEACEVEHSLMLQYLYAAFSVKPRYARLVGEPRSDPTTLMGVAVQEMEHLAAVNRMLVELGGSPNFTRQDFPYEPGIYPFEMTLERLTQDSLAKYVYAEAPRGALDAEAAPDDEERSFVEAIHARLRPSRRPNHIGSLYGTVLARLDELADREPEAPTERWRATVEAIKAEGEDDHYHFFRQVFLGTHQAFEGVKNVWANPAGDAYPSVIVPRNPSALASRERDLFGPELGLARLCNHVYWGLLLLLDLGYRLGAGRGEDLRRHSVTLMTDALYPVAQALAERESGPPFDPLSVGYAPGSDAEASLRFTAALLEAASRMTGGLGAQLGSDRTARVAAALLGVRRSLVAAGTNAPKPQDEPAPVLVAGAGPAGLAAASALASRGLRVRLVEAAPVVGGKADSRREGGRSVEHGVHGWWPVYRNFDRLMREVGVEPDEVLKPADGGDVLTGDRSFARLQDLGVELPSPLFAFVHFLRAPFLTLSDVIGSLPFAVHVLAFRHETDYDRYDSVSFERFADDVRAPEAFKHFVLRPFSVAFDYASADRVSAASILSALQFYVLPFQRALIPRWSRGLPQATVFGPIAKAVNDRGGRVDRSHALESVVIEDSSVVGAQLREAGGEADASGNEVVATVPLAEIPEQGFAPFASGSVLLGKVGGEVRAYSAVCPHQRGRVLWEQGRFVCQKHGGEFDADGQVLARPPRGPLAVLRSRVQGATLQVLGTRRETRVPCSHVIVATDVEAAKSILHSSEGTPPALLERVDALSTTPVIVVRLWFVEGTPVPEGETVVIPDPAFADVYFHLNSFDPGYDVEGVVVEVHSCDAKRSWSERPAKEILDAVFEDLLRLGEGFAQENLQAPDAYEIQRHRSVFTFYKPGDHRNRPGADSGVVGLHLAGDWTRADWSVWMMERAVVSGLRAANRVLESQGLEPVPVERLEPEGMLLTASRWAARLLRRFTDHSR